MNVHAAHSHHIFWPFGKGDIAVVKGLSESTRQHTIKHEDVELHLMDLGVPYRQAHRVALKAEKQ